MRWIKEPTSLLMMKYGLEIDFKVIQKGYAGIFKILNFQNFLGGQSPKFCKNGKNLNHMTP